jgi:dATP pyrophosphohydrolase
MKIIDDIIEAHLFRIRDNQLEFLLLKRSANEVYPLLWQPVTGRMNPGEAAYDAALREIKEETNLLPEEFWVVPNVNSFYNPQKDSVSLIPVFAGRVSADSEILISDEHEEYRWFTFEEAISKLAWPGQRKSAQIISQYFNHEKFYFELVRLI